jgi:LacI family transcriptional regulator
VGRGITIEDVAKAAAVSRQTVSRVINRSPRVSPEAKARVEAAIATLGWVPTPAARSMAGGRSRILLAVFAAPEDGARPARPLGGLLLAGTTACNAHGYRLIFEQLPAEAEAAAAGVAQLAAAIGALEPEGVILPPPLDRRRDLAALVDSRGLARETLAGTAAPPGNPGEAAARHLLALGHRQIGFVAGAGDPAASQANLAAYRRALADSGSRAHHHFVAEVAPDLGATLELARAWLVPTIRPTAIITERAATALAVLHVAASLRIAVPEALSLVSLEDDPALAACQPPVAALHEPAGPLFAAACTRLIARAETPDAAVIPPPPALELVPRASLARAPRAI